VYAAVRSARQVQAIQEQAEKLPLLMRLVVVSAPLDELPNKLASLAPNVLFDLIVGRNVLAGELDKVAANFSRQVLKSRIEEDSSQRTAIAVQ
jgi:putative ATPase